MKYGILVTLICFVNRVSSDQYYYYPNDPKTFEQAHDHCASLGYSMVYIKNQTTLDSVRAYIQANGGTPNDMWIGAFWDVTSSTHRWLDFEAMTAWTPWSGGSEPNGMSAAGGEDCVRLTRNYQFRSFWCPNSKDVICASGDQIHYYPGVSKSWHAAKQHCEDLGYTMLFIKNQTELERVTTHMQNNGGTPLGVWIGGYYDIGTLTHRWLDYEAFTAWSPWSSGEPNGISTTNGEDCVRLSTGFGFKTRECSLAYDVICVGPSPAQPAPEISTGPEIELFYFPNEPKSFEQAKAKCAERGRSMAKIDTFDKLIQLKAKLQTKKTPTTNLWIGMYYDKGRGVHRWVADNAIATWAPWDVGEPNNMSPHPLAEDCVRLSDNFLFESRECDLKFDAICEAVQKPFSLWPPFPNREVIIGLIAGFGSFLFTIFSLTVCWKCGCCGLRTTAKEEDERRLKKLQEEAEKNKPKRAPWATFVQLNTPGNIKNQYYNY